MFPSRINTKKSSRRFLCYAPMIGKGVFFLLWSVVLLSFPHKSLNQNNGAVETAMGMQLLDETTGISAKQIGHIEMEEKQTRRIEMEETIVEELYRSVSHARLANIARTHREHYKTASPFPHIAIDNLFPDSILQKVIKEHPESSLGGNGCLKGQTCFHEATQNKKSGIDKEEQMGTYTRILFSFLKSSIFTKFLADISGIKDIIPDPHFRGSGLHFTAPGGNLNVHADFNKYGQFKLDRRVNLFIYLNNDWPDEYGGHLELWSRDMKSCYERIAPKLGRFVVFSSTDFSYHGHPEPITVPAGRARRSMALYYYTNGRPQEDCLGGDCNGPAHSTLFQKPVGCKKCLDDTCRRETTSSPPTWMAR